MSRYYDSRTETYKRIPTAPIYACSNDEFMSDWGIAKGKINTCVVPCPDLVTATRVMDYMRSRTDQNWIRTIRTRPAMKPGVIYSLLTEWIETSKKMNLAR